MHYSWPGNIRELKNLLESIVLLKKGARIEIDDLPENIRYITDNVSGLPVYVNKTTDQVERELIYGALLGLRADISELKNILIDTIKLVRKQGGPSVPGYYKDISELVAQDENGIKEDLSVQKVEAEAIKAALHRYNGNRKRAAKALGISARTLYRKLKKMDND